MTIRNLEHAVRPRSLAVFGASERDGSVSRIVMKNIVEGGFEGNIWPVNPKYRKVAGRRCYHGAGDLPDIPDLGVIVTPAATVPGIVAALGERGCRAAVVITAGQAERRLRAYGCKARQRGVAVTIGRDRDFADRLGRGERCRLFACHLAWRHGRRC